MRLLIAALLTACALWAMRAVRSIEHPYRHGLTAYFMAFLLHTMTAEYIAEVYGIQSEAYKLVYGAGKSLLLPMIILTGGIVGLGKPRLALVVAGMAGVLFSFLLQDARSVYFKGLNYKTMLALTEPIAYAFAAPMLLSVKQWSVGLLWAGMFLFHTAYLLGSMHGYQAQVIQLAAWLPVVLHLSAFGWLGLSAQD